MRKILLIVLVSLIKISSLSAQTSWEKLFGYSSTDVFRCVREVPAGGYICAGYTANFTPNDTDGWVVRLNTMGDTLWTFKYNGPLSKKDLFYKVLPTADGGFIVCGYTSSVTGTSDDVIYLKLNSSGVQQWVKFWGGSGKDRAQDVIQLLDGNYAIVGYTTSAPALYYDAFFIKAASNGDTLWTKRYGGGAGSYDDANSVKQLSDSGFILGGQSLNGANGYDMYLVRTNKTGTVIWTQKIGTTQTDNIESLAVLPNGFILAGSTNSPANNSDGYLVKTDTGGAVLWDTAYGGIYPDDFHSVEKTTDNGFVLGGTTSSIGAGPTDTVPNMWLAKTDSVGNLEWQKWYGGFRHDHGYSACQTSDGGYILAGHTGSFGYDVEEDAMVVKTKSDGNTDSLITYTTIYQLISPTALTCGGPNTPVTVLIKNFGNAPVSNIPVTVQITGAITQPFNQTFSASADTVTLGTINTSAGGTFTFNCFTSNNNDVCPKRNGITKTFFIEGVSAPPVPVDSSRCGPGSVTLTATAGSPIYWFTSASGGTSISTGTSFTTPSLTSSITYYVQTGVNCPSARLAITANIYSIPQDPVTSGNSHCGPDTIVLSAVAADPINWYTASSGGASVGSGSSYTTPVLNTTTTYYAQASNAHCQSNRIPAVATIGTAPNSPVTTTGFNCGPGTVLLTASSPDSIVWFDALTGGTQVGTGDSLITPVISTNTPYYAQANNGSCLSNRVIANAMIYPVPTINLGPDTSTAAPSYTIDAGSGFAFYSWSNGGNTQIITVTTPDTFCVTVTSANSCTASDCIYVDFNTGISDAGSQKLFTCYPNPSNGKITIELASNISTAAVQLIDITGEVIYSSAIHQSSEVIDLTIYSKGIYFLKLYADGFFEIKKILIE